MRIQKLIDNLKETLTATNVEQYLERDYFAIAAYHGDKQKELLEEYMQAALIVIAINHPDFLEAAVEHQKKWRFSHANAYGFKIDTRVSMTSILPYWPAYQEILIKADKILSSDNSYKFVQENLYSLGQDVLGEYGLDAYKLYVKSISEKNLVLLRNTSDMKYQEIQECLTTISNHILVVTNRNHTLSSADLPYYSTPSNAICGDASNDAPWDNNGDDDCCFHEDNSF